MSTFYDTIIERNNIFYNICIGKISIGVWYSRYQLSWTHIITYEMKNEKVLCINNFINEIDMLDMLPIDELMSICNRYYRNIIFS